MTPLIKSLVGIGLAGGTVGLSVGGYYLLKPSEPKTLEEKFKQRRIEVLDYSYELSQNLNSNDWTKNLNNYKKADSASLFNGLEKSSVDADKLQKECKKYLEKSPKDVDENLEAIVEKWCTKSKAK